MRSATTSRRFRSLRVLWLTVDGWWMQNGHKAPVGKHPFVRISMVPTSSLEDIKTWLTEFCELTYTETANNLRWEKLIPEVVRQPDFYADEYADGESKLSGWDHLIMLVAPEMMQLDDSVVLVLVVEMMRENKL